MESDYDNSLSMDIQNLISCIHWHEGSSNDQVVIETLKTITDLCINNEFGRDALREESGLDFLVEFMFTTDNAVFLEHSLKTLACVIDENIHNQMYMTKKSVFEVIQTILRNSKFPVITRKNAIVLVSAILYQNSAAQTSICEIGLLQDLLNIYEQGAERLLSGNSYAPTSGDPLNELWITSISTLCFAVNNPKHETNQTLCSTIFRLSLRILEFSSNTDIIASVSSLLSLCISNNRYCQDKFANNDGLRACKRIFQKYFNLVLEDIRDCNNMIRKEVLEMLSSITGIISAAVLEHGSNAALLGNLGLLSLLVELLFVKTLDLNLKTKLVLSIGHSIDAFSKNKRYVLEINNFDNLLKENLCLKNHELSSACKYLLQVCIMQGEIGQEECIKETKSSMVESIKNKSFIKELEYKTKTPDNNKESEEKCSRKRPRSSSSSSKSQKECDRKSLSLNSPKSDYDKQIPKKPRTDSENKVTSTADNKDYFNNVFPSSNDYISSSNDSFLTAKSFEILNDILKESPIKELEISDDSSDSSSPYYPAEVLLEQLKSENESSESQSKPCTPSAKDKPTKSRKLLKTSKKNLHGLKQHIVQNSADSSDSSGPYDSADDVFERLKSKNKSSDSQLKTCPPSAKAKSTQGSKLPNVFLHDQTSQRTTYSPKQRNLRDRTNLAETECEPSPKKRRFNFENVLSSPKSPKVGKSKTQKYFTNCNVPSSPTHVKYSTDSCKTKSKAKKTSSTPSFNSRSPKENDFVKVLVFPGEKCDEHNLISSFESLQVVPLDQVKRP